MAEIKQGNTEINRRSVLLECLEYERGLWKLCSKDYDMLRAMTGMDEQFDAQKKKCEILQEMIQALESEHVRRAMADWQKELIEDPQLNEKPLKL